MIESNVFWMTSCPNVPKFPLLEEDIKADVVIVGGGIGGLSCAQRLVHEDISIVLLEKFTCGSGASGCSGGFLVPDPEIYPHALIEKKGQDIARSIWEFGLFGVLLVSETAKRLSTKCDLRKSHSLYLANNGKSIRTVMDEFEARKTLEGESFKGELLEKKGLKKYIGSDKYQGGACFEGTFSFNPYQYCQGVKEHLLTYPNFKIFENSPVEEVVGKIIFTPHGKVEADKVVICSDQYAPKLNGHNSYLPHVQTFILMSEVLKEKDQRGIFPLENVTQAWDTDIVYNYFRLTPSGRLLLGGGDIFNVYANHENRRPARVLSKLKGYFHHKFPDIKPNWKYFWPGQMAVVDDFIGLVGKIEEDYYINAAATGLSMAAAGGFHIAEILIDKAAEVQNLIPPPFSPNRKLFSLGLAGKTFGLQVPLALSHLLSSL